ncbi:COG4 transport protein [Nitzschia inconspicua]|uniref:COG4 transport protein n=1 Tax=Nitzschia inconspicua TaxID=303405 RepID=A0A9K3Q3I8_9STRA|nr:COG4 transport protein [Nitzschia inconspicua]
MSADVATNARPNNNNVPKTMVDALEYDDPVAALMALSLNSKERARTMSAQLQQEFTSVPLAENLPDLLKRLPNTQDADSHPVATAIACSDSILHSLTKIASGGSQASQEIIQLEQEKRDLEEHAQDVETALILRKASDVAAQSLSAQRYEQASAAIHDYVNLQKKQRLTDRAQAYAGEYTVTQLESSKKALRATLLQEYQEAVQASNLQTLGKLTPLLQMVEYEKEAVALYLRFLKGILTQELQRAATAPPPNNAKQNKGPPPPFVPMARVYNCAVTILRHHLPMVSHCLYRADGDAAVVQLVNVQVEQAVLPLFGNYLSTRQLARSSRNAQSIYGILESRYTSGTGGGASGSALDYLGAAGAELAGGSSSSVDAVDDAGFSTQVGSLADVDASLEEAALCLQHAESYTRFIQHTVREVNKARALRFQVEQEEKRVERERREWSTGISSSDADSKSKSENTDDSNDETEYKPLEILPAHTQLQETVAEVGGYYSAIESCLFLASMQRAFSVSPEDPQQYSALGIASDKPVGGALQTSVVEASLYAARRGTQRAFATGHTGTASAVANQFAECLRGVLVQYLIIRAEENGVNPLKPGEGLLTGSSGIFGAASFGLAGRQAHHTVMGGQKNVAEERLRQEEIKKKISWACATLNDLEVASHHTLGLEKLLGQSVAQGFPPNTHETEQLKMCVKSFGPVSEAFKMAADQSVESLVSVLKPRIRAIVTDAVGGDHVGSHAAAGFSSVIGGGGIAKASADRHAVRMNYDLNEEAHQLLEVSESYISRLCSSLDELIAPLRQYLAPRLADSLILGVLATVAKRLEVSLKKCRFTALGALSMDSDMRDLVNYTKDRLCSNELHSNVALYRACTSLARLVQIAKLMNLDDLEDVLDLISSSKRKGNWDLKMEDSKSYLSLRVEFDSERVTQLLRVADEE